MGQSGMSFLNASAKQVLCKVAVHGHGSARIVDAIAQLPDIYQPDDPGFRVVELLARGIAIGPYAMRLCIYALDGSDDLRALLLGADAIAVMITGSHSDHETIASIAPYVTDAVPVVLVCRAGGEADAFAFDYPAVAVDSATSAGALTVLRALAPHVASSARAKWG